MYPSTLSTHKQKYKTVCLDFVESGRVYRLYVVFESGDLLFQKVCADLVVLNHTHNLQLLDAVCEGDEFGGSPHEAVALDGSYLVLEGLHVCLVVPRLHVEQDGGLGDPM